MTHLTIFFTKILLMFPLLDLADAFIQRLTIGEHMKQSYFKMLYLFFFMIMWTFREHSILTFSKRYFWWNVH